MLTRRQLRVKAMQTLYASQFEDENISQKSKIFLKSSIEDITGLHLSLCLLFPALQKHAKYFLRMMEKKHMKDSCEVLEIDRRISKNRLIDIISANDFNSKRFNSQKIINWNVYEKCTASIYDDIRAYYTDREYEDSFKADRDLLIDLFYNVIAPHDKLHDYVEDSQLTWVADLPLVNTGIMMYFREMTPNTPASGIFKNPFKNASDESYIYKLLSKTIEMSNELTQIIDEKTINWEAGRIGKTDLIIMKMALAETLSFSEIPARVTINEYVEISKDYATPKSNVFINGVLDNIIREFESQGRIQNFCGNNLDSE